jgi:hypothetical protein
MADTTMNNNVHQAVRETVRVHSGLFLAQGILTTLLVSRAPFAELLDDYRSPLSWIGDRAVQGWVRPTLKIGSRLAMMGIVASASSAFWTFA